MKLRDWWRECGSREQALLAGGALILVLTAAYLVVEPRLAERRRLAEEIPRLHQDLGWMEMHVAEFRPGRHSPEATDRPSLPLTPAVIESILMRTGIHERVAELRPGAGRGVIITFDSVAYPDLLQFLYRARQYSGFGVDSARFVRLEDGPGMVEANLTLTPRADY